MRKLQRQTPDYGGCINSYDLTTTEMARMGFRNADQLPGLINEQRMRAESTGQELLDDQNSQIPYKVIFLNNRGEDLIYDVRKGRILELAATNEDRIDPVEKFDQLISSCNNHNNNNNNNNNDNNNNNHNNNINYNYQPKPSFEIPESLFRYDRSKTRKIAKRLEQKQTVLTRNEKSFLDSISTTFSSTPNKNFEVRYFKEATMKLSDENCDSGWH
ncbi:uncharacterized protein LODBEIA_P60000 [Lodderomyces beijingensis]|uniref:Uncharacterized protein n=1 Tax=Lodderomyces beijingensis TaxID=1775926 RepID=A0ABP0ZW90_9ASCO